MYIAISVLLSVILISALISYITFRMIFLHSKKKNTDIYKGLYGEETKEKQESRAAIKRLDEAPYKKLSTTSRDNKRLYARYYHKSDTSPLVIAFHGYKSASIRDMARISIELDTLGCNLILPDHRSHRDSDGRVISFGAREKYDVLAWIDLAIAKFNPEKIFLYGISMGASSILMASELIRDEKVSGIIADCPYSSPSAIIGHVIECRGLSRTLLMPFVRLGGILFGRFDIKKHSAVEAVKHTRVPILLIHGDGDTFVPPSMSEEIFFAGKSASKDISLIKIPEATHTHAIMFDRDLYVRELISFIERTTEKKELKNEKHTD